MSTLRMSTFLRTRVARRILGLFMLCAFIPTLALGYVAYRHVGGQLEEQSRERLSQASKAMGMAIIERLELLEPELGRLAAAAGTEAADTVPRPADGESSSSVQRFAVVRTAGSAVEGQTHGDTTVAIPALSPADTAHLRLGRFLLKVAGSGPRPPVLMGRAVVPDDLAQGILWAEIAPSHMWRAEVADPRTELCVFTPSARPVYCSNPRSATSMGAGLRALRPEHGGVFVWEDDQGEPHLAAHWSVFLGFRFGSPSWTVVVSEPRATALAPMANFKRSFPLILVLTLWGVFLLSNILIRRSMEPLLRLQEGTKRVAAQDFGTEVQVRSRDEFGDLATSFNDMGRRLGKQFAALTAINEIDRAVLSALDADRITETVLSRFSDIMPCDGLSISVPPPLHGGRTQWKYVAVATLERLHITRDIELTEDEIQELLESPGHLVLGRHMGPRSYLNDAPEVASRRTCALVLPLRGKETLTGIIVLDYFGAPRFDSDDLLQARLLADQVAVALSNTRLVRELDDLSWGALKALARTIDANSAWTAGHSERVTTLALALGERMALPAAELDTLKRGGLLHDIGKIGIPQSIIEKPGPLTLDEVKTIREHPAIGAKILSPIVTYSAAIPIVLYHHEWFDGSGYPEGLAGEDIPLLARILTVADVYDALTSDRPYRAGWTTQQALGYVSQKASIHFDPGITAVFLEAMQERGFAPPVHGKLDGSLESISSRGRERDERGNWRPTGTQ